LSRESVVTEPRAGLATRAEILARLAADPAIYQAAKGAFPVSWPRYYLELVGDDPARDPIARMGRPTGAELEADPGDIADPIADKSLRPVPFVVRKHRDRVIILAAKRCHFYCRFCFRREEPVEGSAQPGRGDWRRIYAFLADNPDIEEPILSGGDPLTLSDEDLLGIRDQLASIASVKRWRIHTRAPVHFPERVTAELLQRLAGPLPLTIVTHFNHPREVTEESRRIARAAHAADLGLESQAVLLRGVNDDPETQRMLWRALEEIGIGARYLHHPDRVAGNAGFRLTIAQGLAIYSGFAGQLALPPRYVLDLPDGCGKIPVPDLEKLGEGRYRYTHPDGRRSEYVDIEGDA